MDFTKIISSIAGGGSGDGESGGGETGKNFWDVVGWIAEMPTDSTTVLAQGNFNKTLLIAGLIVISAVLMGTLFITYKKK